MANPMIETLRARWSGKFADLNGLHETVTSFSGAAARKRDEIAKPGRLSPAGVGEELRAWLAGGLVGEVKRARKTAEDGLAMLAEQRAKLATPTFDASDTIGAAHRKEAREYLRSLDRAERLKILSEDADPLLVAAALEIPALSGLDKPMIEALQRVYVEKTHGETLAQIEEREEALTALAAAAGVIKAELQSDVAPREGQTFDGWFETA